MRSYNRLTADLYQEPNSTLPQNGFYNETMNYDFNGNITDLKRNEKNYKGFLQEIDDLEYTYKLRNYQYLIPKEIHSTKRFETNGIERKNLNLRTHLKRLNRKTICFSRSTVVLSSILKIYFWWGFS
uniref:IS1 family transposase n=1 Tax=Chryseobacterium formosus TaxID=1537363 RepID=UPI003898E482